MESSKHLVLIRLSAMGDVAMLEPVIKALLAQNQGLKITVVTKAFFGKLFLHLPQVQVLVAKVKTSHKGIFGLWRLSKQIHQLKPDMVVDLHNVLRSRLICGFLKLRGHDYKRFDKGRKQKKALTKLSATKKIKALKTTHQRYANAIKKYQLNLDLNRRFSPIQLEVPARLTNRLPFQLKQTRLVGIAPFATHQSKQYSLELMSEIISEITQTGVQVILFGGGSKEVKQLEDMASSHQNCFNAAGQFSFEDELKLISNLDLMLAMDSGNGHLAAMFGVTVVTIWVSTHPYAGFAPFQQKPKHQFMPDRDQFPMLPLSVYGNKSLDAYAEIASAIDPKIISEYIKKELQKKPSS